MSRLMPIHNRHYKERHITIFEPCMESADNGIPSRGDSAAGQSNASGKIANGDNADWFKVIANDDTDTTADEFHFDVRFVLQAREGEAFQVSDESHDLAWVPVQRLTDYTLEESMLRMARKWLENP